MPRSAKCRRVCQMPTHCRFSPERPAHREAVELTVEEYEALRLMDYLGLNQEEAAAQMGVARTTVQRIFKCASALPAGSAVVTSQTFKAYKSNAAP